MEKRDEMAEETEEMKIDEAIKEQIKPKAMAMVKLEM